MTSEATARAEALVAERLPAARALGTTIAELVDDPETFTRTLEAGLRDLADPAYEAEQERVAPGSGQTIGVRAPLWAAVNRALTRSLRTSASASALWLAQRLLASEYREVRLVSLTCLRRSLPDDPERSWQVMRRLAARSSDWISIDSLADVYALGIRLEPYRWAELEQLAYSPNRGERRLVGSTLARMPHQVPRRQRPGLDVTRPLALVATLIGDADDQVQKSLSWALREWSQVDRAAVERMLRAEAATAATTGDGHRAWVICDALEFLDPATAQDLRATLAGIRRRSGSPSTSAAARAAAAFALSATQSEQAVALQGERYARRSA